MQQGWHLLSRQEFNKLLSDYSSITNADGAVVCKLPVLTALISKKETEGVKPPLNLPRLGRL